MQELLSKAHWEPRRGTPGQAAYYCKKEHKWTERGELPRQGRRTDLDAVGELVLDGAPMKEVAEVYPGAYVKFHKGLWALKSTQWKDRTEPPIVTWLWGATGVGKTRTATEAGPFYIKDSSKWWDGYTQQEVIILDDFDLSWNFKDLLRLLDRYPYQGQTKGGFVKINSPKIFITCDKPPSEFWYGTDLAQIMRRISSVSEVGGNTRPPLLS